MNPWIYAIINFTTKAHDGQRRKGPDNDPYICHPLRVTKMLADHYCSEITQMAAILHDVVEDTQYTLKDIEKFLRKIGVLEGMIPLILNMVDALTIPKEEHKISATRRLGLETVHQDAVLIKIADMIDNSQEHTEEKLAKNRERAKVLLEIFDRRFNKHDPFPNDLANILRARYAKP